MQISDFLHEDNAAQTPLRNFARFNSRRISKFKDIVETFAKKPVPLISVYIEPTRSNYLKSDTYSVLYFQNSWLSLLFLHSTTNPRASGLDLSQNKQSNLRSTNIVFVVLAGLCIGLRFLSRWKKRAYIGIDDYFIVLAYVSFINYLKEDIVKLRT